MSRLISLNFALISVLILSSGSFAVAGASAPPTEPKCRLSIEETIIPDFSCNDSDANCYTQAMAVLKTQETALNAKLKGCPQPNDDVYLNEYDFVNQKSDYVFVYLPGLFTTAAQFWSFKDTVGNNNAVRMTLPGHGATSYDGGRLTIDDWKLAVTRSLNISKYLGKKIILVGQSTGGFMGWWAAAQNKFPIAGLATFEPALKVRNYYGAPLCYLPPGINLSRLNSAIYFEHDLNLGCVVRRFSEEYTPEMMKPETIKILAKIPIYLFINTGDIVVNPQAELDAAKAIIKAGGKVSFETYVDDFEGPHMHGRITYQPLRTRFAERIQDGTDFGQIIRGRNSYAEYLARNFNLCDSSDDQKYLSQFDKDYLNLYPAEQASNSRIDEVIAELKTVTTLQPLSPRSQEAMNAYRVLFEQSSGFRSRLSFVSDGKSMTMQEKHWKELRTLCCDLFESTHKGYTATFSGPLNQNLNNQIAQYRFYITQAAQDKIDPDIAKKLIGLLNGSGTDVIVKVVASDFASAHGAYGGKKQCGTWSDVTSMALSTSILQTQISTYESQHH